MRQYVVKLQRVGRWKRPVYHVVVAFKGTRTHGKAFEKIGFYSPATGTKYFFVNFARLSFWAWRGAYLSGKLGLLLGRLARS